MDISKEQIKKIHTLKNIIGLSDEEYGSALESYGVCTSKELTYKQGDDLIYRLEKLLPKEPKKSKKTKNTKYNNLGVRTNYKGEHYATPKQLRLIEALWFNGANVRTKTQEALLSFVKKITGKNALEWLLLSDVKKVVKAITSLNND